MNSQPLITTTEAVDTAFYVIFGIGGVALIGITVVMVYFAWRYNRKRCPQPISQKDHNFWLEVTWTIIPTILVMIMFWYGWEGYLSLRRVPDNAMPVHASARMWSWLFTYENGKTSDKLYVPVNQPVMVKLIAEDVLHSFYVPAFRVKRDCVPGMETYAWFVAEQPGSYDLFCAEYCGVAHADMITTVEAIPPAEFAAWLNAKPVAADAGKQLLQKHGCLGCHSLDGSPSVGPTFQGIGGRQVNVSTNGESRTLTTDRDYLEKAILEPGVDIVDGFPPAMPAYAGRIPEEELTEIIDYLLSLTAAKAPAVAKAEEVPEPAKVTAEASATQAATDPVSSGEALATQNGCIGCHSTDGTRRVGPSFKGLFGSERAVIKDGKAVRVKADSEYLRRAIREPGAEISEGYPPAMPPNTTLSDEDIKAIEAWLKTLAPAAAEETGAIDPVAQGEAIANQNGCLGCHSIDGTRRVGPTLKGLMGSERSVSKAGQTLKVLADTEYLTRALRDPGAEVVEGYPAAMPPYPGLTADDIRALQAWLETLK